MKRDLGPVIAHRTYFNSQDLSGGPVVEVELLAPSKSPHAEDEFMCSFRVKSPTFDQTKTVYGTDQLHALLLALGYLEAILHKLADSADLSLSWIGGEARDLGIRIPQFSTEATSKNEGT